MTKNDKIYGISLKFTFFFERPLCIVLHCLTGMHSACIFLVA